MRGIGVPEEHLEHGGEEVGGVQGARDGDEGHEGEVAVVAM